jgi:hypothetical protein
LRIVGACVLYVAIAAILLFPTFRDFDRIGVKDWNGFLGEQQAELTTILDHGQFPAWNPWKRGGQVAFAQPESMLCSPVTLLALFVGANAAFKLLLVPLFVGAALGCYALAGDLGIVGVARLVPGAVLVGASIFPLYVCGGLPNWLFGMAILPWLVLANRRAPSSRRWLVAGAALYAGLLYCGNVHHFVFFPLLLLLQSGSRAIRRRSWRPLLATGALGIVGVALSLFRLVPLLEVYSEFPRHVEAVGRFLPISWIGRSLLEAPRDLDHAYGVALADGSLLYWVDCSAYVGVVVLLLAFVGTAGAWRKAWPAALLGVVFLWLSLGSSVTPSLWDALRRLPVYRSMQAPERFVGYVVFSLSLLGGLGVQVVQSWSAQRLGPRAATAVGVGALVAVLASLLWVDAPLTSHAFALPPPSAAPSTLLHRSGPRPPFEQHRFPQIAQQWGGPLYEPVLVNHGNVEGQSDVPTRLAARAVGELGYRGEAYLESGASPVTAEFTPNVIHVRTRTEQPDWLVVNQTFFPEWRARGTVTGDCVPRDGLIALQLPAGEHDLELYFAPTTIPVGGLLALVALLSLVVGWGARRGVAPSFPLSTRSDRVVLASHALLVVGVVGWLAQRPTHDVAARPDWRAGARFVGGVTDPLADVGAALAAAQPGEIVVLRQGHYGAVTIARGVTLVADRDASASVSELTITGVPADETVFVVGVDVGGVASGTSPGGESAHVPTLRIDRCDGAVVLQDVGAADTGGVLAAAPRLVVANSGNVHGFGLDLSGVTATDSRVGLARGSLERASPATGSERIASATRSVLLLNRVHVQRGGGAGASSGSSSQAFELADHSLVRHSQCDLTPADFTVDAASSAADLGDAALRFSFTRTSSTDPWSAELRGPPHSRGTIVVAPRTDFRRLEGRNSGQFVEVDFTSSRALYHFDLLDHGAMPIPVPHFDESARPDDAYFVQAWIDLGPDPNSKAKQYTLLDGRVAGVQ